MESPLTLVRYDLDGLDPYLNLAIEEHLTRTCPDDTVRLVFYRNASAVVIGRNQDPWGEVDLAEAARLGVAVVRRVSGGGAVVHDEGNLNYGFIMPRPLYAPARFLRIVVEALGSLGVVASACTRSSIWVQDRKVSGTAFLLTGRSALLHGCILVHSDLELLRRLLAPPLADRRSRAVASTRAAVTRLCAVSPTVTLDAVREAIAVRAAECFGVAVRRDQHPSDPASVATLAARLRSWEWLYGRTADFEHVLHLAGASVTLQVKGGMVSGVLAADQPGVQAALHAVWPGCAYDGAGLAVALAAAATLSAEVKTELAAALQREIPALAPSRCGDPPPLFPA